MSNGSEKIIDENEFVWPVKNVGEDTVISVMYAYYSKVISYVNEPLLYYCYHSDSFTHARSETLQLKKFDSFYSNIMILFDFMKQNGLDEIYAKGIINNKILTKQFLAPLTNKVKYRRMWLRTFPEVNKVLLFGNKYYKPKLFNWIIFFSVITGIYPSLARLRNNRH